MILRNEDDLWRDVHSRPELSRSERRLSKTNRRSRDRRSDLSRTHTATTLFLLSIRRVSGHRLQETLELLGPNRVLQFADGLRFDLADAFAGHLKDPADFFEGVGVAVTQAIPQLDDLAFAIG